ncbi:hypothetical protein HFV02_05380 [Acidithiobacillus caldus]|uniref:hypothetical protein n=1 Tax=Acidithiobacillus caldus TaxID=33059 RepID=UPI001C06D743|nr:hypothetical protein [Acidithiobacillus caldus]MBU2801695.1 hypothetical protein [Acidithiobacillus caldus]
MKKAPDQTSIESPAQEYVTTTTAKGRRATTSLWFAIRTLNGAALTPDDLALIREALIQIGEVLK